MLSTKDTKFIKSLQLKKFRQEHSCFLVEGRVNILEALGSDFILNSLYITEEAENEILDQFPKVKFITIKKSDLEKIGTYQSNNFGLAVFEMKENQSNLKIQEDEWALAFDCINDPGNLGTIIRTADWFGVSKIFCSSDSVEFYNPKVINSTKGSFARVAVNYVDLNQFLKDKLVVSAEMDGHDYRAFDFPSGGVLLMGNESHGVSTELSKYCRNKITIPKIGKAESLNVAIATALLLGKIKLK